ncbi:NAD-dependent epimerase/dehydratase family protein [Vibrio spartinae]|uniref:UDP-glucose 4-epimerase n=1 Tax=Vibrio spartinae TaxID=1918945 RepID=A0A1N6MAI4_9VIBR|nr:NAD-dependent epimerase/dehydratase family protein [Vibrio spartinae]SIO96367.1 UDP-glucose 4-epimerase [Vibrio spartinae]
MCEVIVKNILVTGSAGFIGFHLTLHLLQMGLKVTGVDALTDYYDVELKKKRLSILQEYSSYQHTTIRLEDKKKLLSVCEESQAEVIVHLAAQAGVRYSIDHPNEYLDTNITGTFNILECARITRVKHLLMASTSSVYGANTSLPFDESQHTDNPLTFYAATKKCGEIMAHSYSHLFELPITVFRFFTVYGPWGRPDMALFKFTQCILNGDPIDIYNGGEMYRDFTYVADLTQAIILLLERIPRRTLENDYDENASSVAPFRIVNIGNSEKVKLMDFIEAIEDSLHMKAKKNYLPMQQGDVPATWADCTLLKNLTGYQPQTHYSDGILEFVNWYREFYFHSI